LVQVAYAIFSAEAAPGPPSIGRTSDDAAVDEPFEPLADRPCGVGRDRIRIHVDPVEADRRDLGGDVERCAGWADRHDDIAALDQLRECLDARQSGRRSTVDRLG